MTAGRREWIGLAVLALPTLLLSLDMSVLYLALPQLAADLHASPVQQLWIMDIYGFFIAGFLVTMGTLGDRIGRRRLLMIGGAAFAAASVVAAFSVTPEMLIGARALLGIAGATLMPSTLALISNMFHDAHQRGIAISVWMTCFMGGMTVGPLVGGVLLTNFWWGAAFLLGVPVMVLLLLLAPMFLPEYRDADAGRFDLPSVALLLATVLPVVYGLKELAQIGWRVDAVAALVVGAGFGVAFARRQLRLAHPLLDLSLFRNRGFSVALAIQLIGGIVMAGMFLLINVYLQLVQGLGVLEAGLWIVPLNVAMAISTLAAPHLVKRIRTAHVMAAGFVIALVGLLAITQVGGTGGLLLLIGGFLLMCVGIAWPTALGTQMVIESAPKEKAGAAAGMSETAGEFGIAFGVAMIGSIAGAVFRARVEVPAGAPAEAGDSIATAAAAAPELPADVAGRLLASAQDAFASGLNVVAGIGVVLFAALAVVSVVALRQKPEPARV